jgi:hypothetical protein
MVGVFTDKYNYSGWSKDTTAGNFNLWRAKGRQKCGPALVHSVEAYFCLVLQGRIVSFSSKEKERR